MIDDPAKRRRRGGGETARVVPHHVLDDAAGLVARRIGVVMAAEGYPEKVTTGDAIEGLAGGPDDAAIVHHAGTRLHDGQVVTAGGRVLCVTAEGATLEEARDRAYARVATVRFRGEHHRSDIGARALIKR